MDKDIKPQKFVIQASLQDQLYMQLSDESKRKIEELRSQTEDMNRDIIRKGVYGMDDYQNAALLYRIKEFPMEYFAIGLCEEAGEVAGKIKKAIRDNEDGQLRRLDYEPLAYELGDVLWYLSMLAAKAGYRLSDIAEMNLQKLERRKMNNTLHGSGDNR